LAKTTDAAKDLLHRSEEPELMRFSPTVLLPLVLIVAACGTKEGGADAKQGGPGGPGGPPPEVTVANPLIKPIVDWDEYTGRFEAVEESEVRPRVSGYIKSVNFRDGEFARAGALLFVIDPRPFEAVLAQARADAARLRAAATVAQTSFARTRTLLEANAVSKEEFEQAQATLAQANAALASGEATIRARALDVEFTRVTAPISGRLSDRRLDVGNYVTAGTTVLTTVVKLDPIYFTFTGSEAVYLKYQRANRAGTRPSSRLSPNPVEIRLGDETNYTWRGKMNFVDNALDQGSGTIRGRASVRNPDGFLTPGLFGHMRLLGSGAYNGMLIPEASVVTDQTQKVALIVGPDNKIAQRNVELGPLVDGLRVVRSGLKPTDRVIIAGVQRGRPGSPVTVRQGRIVPPAPGTGPQPADLNEPAAAAATSASAAR
jgi:RND family efflux transporter MFP subunit